MTGRWIKDGVFADMTMEIDGRMVSNPTDEQLRAAGFTPYVPTDTELLAQAKESKVQEIERYDTSDKVNGFKLNGAVFWLDKATRVGLMNSTTIAKAMGNETTDLWLGEARLTIGCDKVIQLLSGIEMYALECFNTTARHKAEVQELKTVKEVEGYDVTEGYPNQLEINV